jgi:hypothetical protein
MVENEKNSIKELIAASDVLPEPQRQRVLGIAEGILIATSKDTTDK